MNTIAFFIGNQRFLGGAFTNIHQGTSQSKPVIPIIIKVISSKMIGKKNYGIEIIPPMAAPD
jgi:hypothetical protein